MSLRAISLGLAILILLSGAPAGALETLRRGNMAEPDTLDPQASASTWEHAILADLFLGLTTENMHGEPIPGAAERWDVSTDALTWTFHLRPNLKWSDGAPLKASDAVFGFRRLFDPKQAAKYASLYYIIKNAEGVNAGKMPLEKLGVRAVDDRTVEITLEAPAPYLPGLLSSPQAYPVPQHAIAKHGEAWTRDTNMVSSGAFKLTLWRPHDQVRAVKNPLFYDAANVRLDEVIYYPIDDETVALTRFRAHEIDGNYGTRGFPINQLDWLKANMPGVAHITTALALEYMVPNFRRPPFNDARVRRAISLCVDRETVANKVMRDGRVPAHAIVPPGTANARATARLSFADWPMDKRRAEAKRLLADAGFTADRPLTFEYVHMTGHDARRSIISEVAMLKDCGIIARTLANEPKVHYAMFHQFDFSFAKSAWRADFNDPQTFLGLLDSRAGAFNSGGYVNPAFDALLDRARITLDLGKRAELLAEAEQIALNDDAFIPVMYMVAKELSAPYVKGFAGNVTDMHPSRWMWIEGRP